MIKQKVKEIKNKIEEAQILEKEIKILINIVRFLFSISLVLAVLSDANLIMMPNVKNAIAFSVSVICLVICSICLGKSNSDGKHLLQDIKELEKKEKEYNSIQETEYLLQNKENRKFLEQSIQQLKNKQTITISREELQKWIGCNK